jgi:CubicO group peptidase (beta-lactamase class C family)
LILSRRDFAGALAGLGLSLPLAGQVRAQGTPSFATAVDTIRAQAFAHQAAYGLPGMTVGLIAPDGLATRFDVGFANLDARRPATPDTLWQVGSISKLMVALIVHQFAAEGRFALSDQITTLMPEIPVPKDAGITVQHLLDHNSGLPDSAPLFPDGGLWVGYRPGAHWSYSNTGYDILGKLAEHTSGKPLARLLKERLFDPLGMKDTSGAIVAKDRTRYAQGYEPANNSVPFVRGTPLAPAAWVDVTFGAGSVTSTSADMNRLLGALAAGAKGGSLPGLDAPQTKEFLTHSVPASADLRYGNGFMHVASDGRPYLHHTGGMVSFSSSFHLDPATGVAAFASSSLSGLAGYRPREFTRFAVDALDAALGGKPLPTPPRLDDRVANPSQYFGRFAGPAGAFEVIQDGGPLMIRANGKTAMLQSAGDDLFATAHPDFDRYGLLFERRGKTVTGASWGADQYAKAGSGVVLKPSDPKLARLAGRYVNDSPWWGLVEIVERGGNLWLGTDTPLVSVGPNLWRVGSESWSPERASFHDPIDGRPQTFVFSGEKFIRHGI